MPTRTARALVRLTALACWATLAPVSASAQVDPQTGIDMVLVSAAGNAADSNGLGAVAEPYRIGRLEITNAQWVALLNAVAADDTHGLFDEDMTDSDRGGILRSGPAGAHVYATKPDFEDKPANFCDWYDAARYCNWLHNGQPGGAQTAATTEDGVYDLSLPGHAITRAAGATWFLPSHDQWYKAAYHDPFDAGADAGGTPDYWAYPTRSDSLPAAAQADAGGDVTNPGPQVANADKGADWNGENGNVTTVGGCAAPGPWGTLDQGGNLGEMTDTPGTPIPGPPELPTRRMRGGDFSNAGVIMRSDLVFGLSLNMAAGAGNVGARVAAFAAWVPLGDGLAGAAGVPQLTGAGMTTAGTAVSVQLDSARPLANVGLVVGLSQLSAPFKGGTLVPFPDVIVTGLSTDGAGTLVLPAVWPPAIPAGSRAWLQAWVDDPAGPAGFAASNALLVRTP